MEGNQMKMRKTLLAIKEVADRDMRHHVSMSESDQTSIRAWSNLFVSLVDSALAETPRNCDYYDNKTDAETMFVEETGENDMAQHYWQMFANWLFAPAQEQKGDGDGK